MKNFKVILLAVIAAIAVSVAYYVGKTQSKQEKVEEQDSSFKTAPILFSISDPKNKGRKGLLEDEIRFPEYELPYDSAVRMIAATKDNLRLNGLQLPALAAEISTSALRALADSANALPCGPPTCTYNLPGVKIHFGMNSINNLMLYYEIIYFCSKNAPANGKGFYEICSEGKFYVQNFAGNFQRLTTAELDIKDDDINRYQKTNTTTPFGIQVRDPASNNFETYNEDKDVRFVIFPIRQLEQNSVAAGGTSVRLWNVPLGYSIGHLKTVVHSLLASTSNVSLNASNVVTSPADAVYSDLAHICPPGCKNGYQFQVD